jgi:hypothetical protein
MPRHRIVAPQHNGNGLFVPQGNCVVHGQMVEDGLGLRGFRMTRARLYVGGRPNWNVSKLLISLIFLIDAAIRAV